MNKTMARAILLICMSVFFFSFQSVFASSTLARPLTNARRADAAQEFSLKSLKDRKVSLKSYKGKGVILFFFTTWCPHCRSVLPFLYKNQQQFKSENIELLLIDVDESPSKVEAFLKKQQVDFDVLMDTGAGVARMYNVVGVPTFIFISKDGSILYCENSLPRDYANYFK